MRLRPGRYLVRALVVAAASALAACSPKEGSGLKVTVDLAAYAHMVETLRVVIRTDMDGFTPYMGGSVTNVGVKTEDLDGDGKLELIVQFVQPDPTVSFRVETGNQTTLNMTAHAMAFGSDAIIASATEGAALPPGGEASVALQLATDTTPISVNTRTTDLSASAIDVAVQGAQTGANMASIAVCDVDGDGSQDIVIGAPGETTGILGPTGAVTIVWGGWQTGATVDLADMNQNAETRFVGTESAAQLGAAVACVDLDGDQADDIIVGAPGADNGRGRIYAVFGQPSFRASRTVDLSMATTGAEITWTTARDNAALGSTLFAVTRRSGIAPYILATAPGLKVTHLFSDVRPSATGPKQIDSDAADHPTFTGVAAQALAAGDLDSNAPSSKRLDVAIGDPTYRDTNDLGMGRGRVYLFADVDPTGTAPIDIATANPTITGVAPTTQLGRALLIADTSGQGEDLLVGAPGEDDTAGAVYLFANNPSLFLPPELVTTADTTIKIAVNEPAGLYGSALASTRAGSSNGIALRLAVGAPGVSRADRAGVGAAYLYKASSSRKFLIYDQVYGKAAGDMLGAVVAGGQLNGDDQIGDLAAVAPNASGSSAAGAGVVYVRFGQ